MVHKVDNSSNTYQTSHEKTLYFFIKLTISSSLIYWKISKSTY